MTAVLVWVGVGMLGGAGALARFLVDAAISSRSGWAFPAGTFAVNTSGALILGVLVGLALKGDALLLAGTAVIGTYTTMSAWMFETHRLAEEGQRLLAVANLGLSLVAGVAAAALGRLIAGG
jgi:fluoride exporter